jgi:hypothetical protein
LASGVLTSTEIELLDLWTGTDGTVFKTYLVCVSAGTGENKVHPVKHALTKAIINQHLDRLI